jgi:hypothetical protein
MDTLANSWTIENPIAGGASIELRDSIQYAAVNGTLLIVSGGSNTDTTTSIVDQTIVYDVQSKSWKKYPNYEENPYGNRQM